MASTSSSISALHLPPEWLEDLAVFPLPNTVFFPGTALPLHIFEPRYRTMMRDVLDSGRQIMAVTLLRPGFERDYAGRPPIHDLCTIGRFDTAEELPDGRFNFVLEGLARVRLSELPCPSLPYRRARAEVIENVWDPAGKLGPDVTALMSTAALVATHVRRMQPEFSLGITTDLTPGQIADVLADRLVSDPAARQSVLETLEVRDRVRLVTELVADVLGAFDAAPRGSDRPLQ